MRNQKALHLVAIDLAQQFELLRRLDPFGDHGEAELAAQGDDAGQGRGQAFAFIATLHQRAVDLEFGEGRRDQAHVGAVAFAEVVLGQAETFHAQAAGTRIEVAQLFGNGAFHQLEAELAGHALVVQDEFQQAVGQVMAVQQVGRQVDRHRDVIAPFPPARLGIHGLLEHHPQQPFLQAEGIERWQEGAWQQHALLRMHPAHQRLGRDDAAVVQGLLGLEPGLEGPVVQGIDQGLAVEFGAGRRGLGRRLMVQLQLVDQAAQCARLDGLGDQPEHVHAEVLGHQAGRHQHAPRGRAHDRQAWLVAQPGEVLDELHTVHARHQQVGQDQVEVTLAQALQRFLAIPGRFQVEAAEFAEQVLQVHMLEWVVFDDQDVKGLQDGYLDTGPGS